MELRSGGRYGNKFEGGTLALALLFCSAAASAQCVPCYGTFGVTSGGIVSTNLWCVTGVTAGNCSTVLTREIAAPFSVISTGPLVSITLGLQYGGGTNGAIVSLAIDSGHGPGPGEAPGNVLESWTITNLPTPSIPPALVTLPDRLNVTLQGGQEYWLLVQPIAADTQIGWYRTPNSGLNGDGMYLTSVNNGAGWVPLTPDGLTGTQCAFEIGGWQEGTLAHFAAGAGWTTLITVTNPSASSELLEVLPLDEMGNYITAASGVTGTTTQGGTVSSWPLGSVLVLPPNQSILLTLAGGATTAVGSVSVSTTGAAFGYAVFHWAGSPGGFPSDGTVRLQTETADSASIPYDNTTGFVTGVALASTLLTFNPAQSEFPGTATVTAKAWDDGGNSVGVQSITLNRGGHTSFVMSTEFPASSGKRGFVQFTSVNSPVAAVGLRWTVSSSGVLGTLTDTPVAIAAPLQ